MAHVNITDHANMNLENDHATDIMLRRLVAEYGEGSTADALSWVSRNLALNMAELLKRELTRQLAGLLAEAIKWENTTSIETTSLEWHAQPATRDLLRTLLSGLSGKMAIDVPAGMLDHMANRYAKDRRDAFAGFMNDLLMHGWNETEFYQLAREYAPGSDE